MDHKPWDRDQQFFEGPGVSDRAVRFFWNQRPKFIWLLELGQERIRNLGTKTGSAMKSIPRYVPEHSLW